MSTTDTIAPEFTAAERKALVVIDEHGTATLAARTFVPTGTVHAATARKLVAAGVLRYTQGEEVVARVIVENEITPADVELAEAVNAAVRGNEIVPTVRVLHTDTLQILEAAKAEHDAEKAGEPGPFPNLELLRSQYADKLAGKPAKRIKAAARAANTANAENVETLVCVGAGHASDAERVLPVSAFQLYENGKRRTECRSCCKARVAAAKAAKA